MAKMSEAE